MLRFLVMSDDVRTRGGLCFERNGGVSGLRECSRETIFTADVLVVGSQGPTPAPTSPTDDEIKFGSTTNIMGMSIFILIILVAFMCAGSLIW